MNGLGEGPHSVCYLTTQHPSSDSGLQQHPPSRWWRKGYCGDIFVLVLVLLALAFYVMLAVGLFLYWGGAIADSVCDLTRHYFDEGTLRDGVCCTTNWMKQVLDDLELPKVSIGDTTASCPSLPAEDVSGVTASVRGSQLPESYDPNATNGLLAGWIDWLTDTVLD